MTSKHTIILIFILFNIMNLVYIKTHYYFNTLPEIFKNGCLIKTKLTFKICKFIVSYIYIYIYKCI